MWDRKLFKEKGKAAFRGSRGPYICVLLMVTVISIVISLLQGTASSLSAIGNMASSMDGGAAVDSIVSTTSSISAPSAALIGLITLFFLIPLSVGIARFSLLASRSHGTEFKNVWFGFKSGNYFNIVLVMLLKLVYTMLWTFLFIIPGLIKSYSYALVEFILAENPDMKHSDAITLSRKMMDGYKWKMFVMELSFLGWLILGALTLGILDILWVMPYMQASYAEAYKFLKEKAIDSGLVSRETLPDAGTMVDAVAEPV